MISPKMDRYDYRHMYKRFIETSNEDYKLTLGKINHYSSLLNKLKFNIEVVEMKYVVYLVFVFITFGNGILMNQTLIID